MLLLTVLVSQAQVPRPAPFVTPLAPADMKDQQAVIETTAGTFVIALLADPAPNHVGYFIKLAREGTYNGTTFHRVVRGFVVQGGSMNFRRETPKTTIEIVHARVTRVDR